MSLAFGAVLINQALAVDLDPNLPAYKGSPLGSATIKSIGSDMLAATRKRA